MAQRLPTVRVPKRRGRPARSLAPGGQRRVRRWCIRQGSTAPGTRRWDARAGTPSRALRSGGRSRACKGRLGRRSGMHTRGRQGSCGLHRHGMGQPPIAPSSCGAAGCPCCKQPAGMATSGHPIGRAMAYPFQRDDQTIALSSPPCVLLRFCLAVCLSFASSLLRAHPACR